MAEYFYDEYEPDYEDFSYDYEELEPPPPRFNDIVDECIVPSLGQLFAYMIKSFGVNLAFRLATQIYKLPLPISHAASAASGMYLICLMFEEGRRYIFGIIGVAMMLLMTLRSVRGLSLGYIVSVVVLPLLLVSEYLEPDRRMWHQIRGTLMILLMKVISLGFDIDSAKVKEVPDPVALLGYLLCPANVLLGPWVPFNEYKMIFEAPPWNLAYFAHIVTNAVASALFLLCSNCFVLAWIPDTAHKWVIAYRDALAFRCSHYFVSFFSQTTMTVAGFDRFGGSRLFGYEVTEPLSMELPRSLTRIVVRWNVPMHNWLKQYVFRVVRPYSTFLAVFITYVASALLHGLNVQLAVVLLSLGVYTYVEYRLRHKLCGIYSACIRASHCPPDCQHELPPRAPLTAFLNVFFGALALYHLTYLGVMFEAAFEVQEEGFSFAHLIEKWSELDFASHWTTLFCFVFYLVI